MNTPHSIDFWSQYMLPSAVTLTVFYVLYKIIVRNDTHFQIRRFTILGALVFAIILPFLNFQIPVNAVSGGGWSALYTPVQNFIYELPVFTVFAEGNVASSGNIEQVAPASMGIFDIMGWIYLIIVLFLVGRGFVGVLRLAAFSRKGKRLPTEDATIISSPNIPTAFSFFKTVFIPETLENETEKNMILAHERVHVKQKHSWDLMLMELVCAVQFFNPFAWLLKHEMRLNHEYLADQGALSNNENPEQYFQLLLREIVGKQPILVHSFHYSPLKYRIMMQLSKPAKMLNRVRYLAFVPVALALTFLFACREENQIQIPENSEYIFLTAEQLKPLGFTLNENGFIFANYNPNAEAHGLRHPFISVINNANNYSSTFQNFEISPNLERFDSLLKGIEIAQLDLLLIRVASNGRVGFEHRWREKEKLVPIAFRMAETGIPNRTDTLVFWFIPTEDLQNALPRGVNMANFLRYPPMSETRQRLPVVSLQDTLFTQTGLSLEELYRLCNTLGVDSIIIVFRKTNQVFVYRKLENDVIRDDGVRLSDVRNQTRLEITGKERELFEVRIEKNQTPPPPSPTPPPIAADYANQVFIMVETEPQFPGGEDARTRFLQENIRYPEEARNKKIQGTVFVQFVVERDGSLSNIEVVRGIGSGADEEVIRVMQLMPNWIPGQMRGRNVRVQFVMPVRFLLSD